MPPREIRIPSVERNHNRGMNDYFKRTHIGETTTYDQGSMQLPSRCASKGTARSSWTQTLRGLCDVRLASLHPHQGTRAEVWAAKKRQDTSLFTALLSLPPTAMAIAVAPPTVTMMTMVIVPVVMMAMVIVAVVNRRTKIVLGGGFADWRHRSRVSARHWS
jgi:hypothetical protein